MIVFSPCASTTMLAVPEEPGGGSYVPCVHSEIIERGQELATEDIVAGDCKKDRRIAEPCNSYGLIASFAS